MARHGIIDYVVEGEGEEGKRYREDEFNRVIEIMEREAYRVKLFMDTADQSQKTLVFCATQVHALAVRDLINQMKKSTDPNYCVRVTANDGKIGEQHLRTFQDNEKTIPTILTTLQKLSTGVDARNIRNIVLMRPINSMIEFKQIIGRGPRLFDGKDYFTIYVFVKAYEHFNDPEWDGEPAEPVVIEGGGGGGREGGDDEGDGGEGEPPRPQKLKIKLADGKERLIQHMIATTFYSPDGKLMSAAEFIQRLYGELPELFKDEDELRKLWGQPASRKALQDGLTERGYGEEQLDKIKRMINAEKSDLYDVLAYIAFALALITRRERVDSHKAEIFDQFDHNMQTFLDFVLNQYVKEGVSELEEAKLTLLLKAKYGNVSDAIEILGGVPRTREAFIGFQQHLY